MGFVDGWSPMSTRRLWPAPFDTDLEARRGLAFQLVEGHRAARQGRLAGQGPPGPGRPEGFHERQVDRWTASWNGSGPRDSGFDKAAAWLRAHRPIDYIPGLMHGDYQFANVMFEHGGPAACRHRRLGDGHRGRSQARSGLGRAVLARRHLERRRRRQKRRVRRHDWHAAAGRGPGALRRERRAGRSTTSTTTVCWPSGSSPSSWSRVTSGPATTRSSRPSVRSSTELMQAAADLAESTDYSVLA